MEQVSQGEPSSLSSFRKVQCGHASESIGRGGDGGEGGDGLVEESSDRRGGGEGGEGGEGRAERR